MKVGRKGEATPNAEYNRAYRTINPPRGAESRRLASAISVMASAAFARRHIACAKDQRSSHFGACSVCFQLAGRRGVTILKPLVFGNHLRPEQYRLQQAGNGGRPWFIAPYSTMTTSRVISTMRSKRLTELWKKIRKANAAFYIEKAEGAGEILAAKGKLNQGGTRPKKARNKGKPTTEI